FQDAFQQQFNNIFTDVFTEQVIQQGTTNQFQEFLVATTGNDNLVGGDSNTQFLMTYGTSLGGTDTVNGGGGTDELALKDLYETQAIYDATAKTITYSNLNGTIHGVITLTSIEQVFAAGSGQTLTGINSGVASGGATLNSGATGVRLAFEDSDSGKGYIWVGGTSGDTLSLANNTSLGYGSLGHTIVGANTFGGILAGLDGDDTLTGSAHGDNIIFGGTGADTVNLTTAASQNNALYGEAGNDIFVLTGTNTNAYVGAILGGDGTDTVKTGDQVFNLGTSGFNLAGIEAIESTYGGGANTIVVRNDFLPGASGSVTTISAGAGSSILQSSGATLNIYGVTSLDGDFTTLKAGISGSAPGIFYLSEAQLSGITTFQSLYQGGEIHIVGGGPASFVGKTFTDVTSFYGSNAANDTLIANFSDIDTSTSGKSFWGMAGTDTLEIFNSAGTLADADFANIHGFETFKLADAAGGDYTFGSNAQAAFGGSFTIDGAAVANNAVTINGSGLTGVGFTLDLSNSTANNVIYGGTGNVGNDTITAGSGNDTITGNGGSDVINVGAGNDVIKYDIAHLHSSDPTTGDIIKGWAQGSGSSDTIWFDTFALIEGDGVGTGVGGLSGETTGIDSDTILSNESSVIVKTAASAALTFSTGNSLDASNISTAIGEIVGRYATAGDIVSGGKHILLMEDGNATSANRDLAIFLVSDSNNSTTVDSGEVKLIAVIQDAGTTAVDSADFVNNS
ncbi:MAG: hypothetical protein H7841_18255, partial [Magnetospirillum sp. WYHS-4]